MIKNSKSKNLKKILRRSLRNKKRNGMNRQLNRNIRNEAPNHQVENIVNTDSTIHKIKIIYNFNTLDSQKKGLMYIKSPLPKNTGALFTYDEADYKSFWMKNTFIPLDILLLDENYKIVCIHTNAIPLNEQHLFCEHKTLYAIETNAGYVSANNIKLGDFMILINDN
jgi:uncharacterized membrane protein (UPF0127 family)